MSTNDPYNRSGYYIFLGTMAASILFFVYIAFIHPGVKGVDKNVITDYSPESDAKKFDLTTVTEPWLSSDDMIAAGSKSFQMNCALCHGADAKGLAAMGSRDLVEGKWKKGGRSIDLFNSITNGLEKDPNVPAIMAPFKHLPVNERWALVHYIRSITQNKPEDNQDELKAFGQTSLQGQ